MPDENFDENQFFSIEGDSVHFDIWTVIGVTAQYGMINDIYMIRNRNRYLFS